MGKKARVRISIPGVAVIECREEDELAVTRYLAKAENSMAGDRRELLSIGAGAVRSLFGYLLQPGAMPPPPFSVSPRPSASSPPSVAASIVRVAMAIAEGAVAGHTPAAVAAAVKPLICDVPGLIEQLRGFPNAEAFAVALGELAAAPIPEIATAAPALNALARMVRGKPAWFEEFLRALKEAA